MLRRPGRPRIPVSDKMSERIVVLFNKAESKRLFERCQHSGASISQFIRAAIAKVYPGILDEETEAKEQS